MLIIIGVLSVIIGLYSVNLILLPWLSEELCSKAAFLKGGDGRSSSFLMLSEERTNQQLL